MFRKSNLFEGFASAASPVHSREGWSEWCLDDLWGSWEVSGFLFVLLGVLCESLGVLCASLGVLLGSLGVPRDPLGVPWGSLGCEGMRWETEVIFLLIESKVFGIAGGQHVIFA